MSEQPSRSELLEAVQAANELLGDAMDHANSYGSHDEVRPSAILAMKRAEEAHVILSGTHPGWENPQGEDDE